MSFDASKLLENAAKDGYTWRNAGVQNFLFSILGQLSGYHSRLNFNNFIALSDADPGSVVNKLVAYDSSVSSTILSLRPAQIALLQPMIRIFTRDAVGNEVELVFQDFHNDKIERMSSEELLYQVPNGVGIKEASLSILDNRPGDINLLFKLSLHFQSITKFAGAHLDLIKTPDITTESTIEEFRLKAIIGWAVPPSNPLFSEDEIKAISKMKRILLLGLIQHDISFNQDGSIDLNIEYQSSIESGMSSDGADIFKTTDTVPATTTTLNYFIQLRRVSIENLKLHAEKLSKNGARKEDIEEIDKKIIEGEEDIAKLEESLKIEKWNSLLTSLQERGRMFFLKVPQWELISQGLSKTSAQTTQILADRESPPVYKGPFLLEGYKAASVIRRAIKDPDIPIDEISLGASGLVGNEGFMDWQQFRVIGDSVYLIYTTLGDLIDAASANYFNERPTQHLVLGTFSYTDPLTRKETILSLADIPISISQFNIWFMNNVVRTNQTRYPLYHFIQDIIKGLIQPGMISRAYPAGVQPPTFLLRKVIHFSENGPTHRGRMPIFSLNLEDSSSGVKKDSKGRVHQYVILYVDMYEPEMLTGNEEYDASKGIYHFKLGVDHGILKKATFSKTDISKLRDSRMVSDELNGPGAILRDAYDVELTLVGNALFHKEQYFYINGSYLGQEGKYYSELLGLGGYYITTGIEETIGPGGYETIIKGTFQTYGGAKKKPEPASEYKPKTNLKQDVAPSTKQEKNERINKFLTGFGNIE